MNISDGPSPIANVGNRRVDALANILPFRNALPTMTEKISLFSSELSFAPTPQASFQIDERVSFPKSPGAGVLDIDSLAISKFQPLSLTSDEIMASREAQFVIPFELDAADGSRFNAVSLEQWIKFASDAGIPFVPADVVATIPVSVLLTAETPSPDDAGHWAALKAANGGTHPSHMVRWDCCAGLDLKIAMDMNPEDVSAYDRTGLHAGDPRFCDILYVYPAKEVSILRRPWVETRMEGTHPAEYRVYIEGGEIVGISSYYPQRAMPLDAVTGDEVRQTLLLAQSLLDQLKYAQVDPWFYGSKNERFEGRGAACTLDFLVEATGKVMFLEGGPPFGAGADPCCFQQNRVDGDISVKGVCLDVDQRPLPIENFMDAHVERVKPFRPTRPGR